MALYLDHFGLNEPPFRITPHPDFFFDGADPVFVYHTPAPSTAANGEFDDQFTWITVGELYGRLIAAGQLP